MAIYGCCLVKLPLICLLIWYHSIIYASWISENQREKPLNQTCQLTLWNPNQACLLLPYLCYLYARWSSATPRRELLNMSLQLQQIYLLTKCNWHKHRCWSNMPTDWVLLQDGRLLDRCYSISMPVDLLPLNPACLLVWCIYICYSCNRTYMYLLVLCVTISRACWWSASLKLCIPL